MIIKRNCPFTGNVVEKEISVTQEQLDRWISGELIQNVMPELSPDDREFIMTGITPEKWESLFLDSDK